MTSVTKRKKKAADDEEALGGGDFFLADDDKKKGAQSDDDGADEELEETAEEKRLRLARAYLDQMQAGLEDGSGRRGVTGGVSDEDEGSSGDDDGRDMIAKRLREEAAEASGRVQRRLAGCLVFPSYGKDERGSTPSATSAAATLAAKAAFKRGHRLPATAVALAADDSFAVSVSKDGSILKWDMVTMQKTRLYRPGEQDLTKGKKKLAPGMDDSGPSGPDWVKRNPRQASKRGLYAAALSSDNKFLAVGGGDRKVHVFDAISGAFVQSFPGHRDAVTALAFREGTHQLFSGSYDRTVKMWSIDDRAYMDSLFGHQAEVLSLDVGRAERAVTGGNDHSCRIWKVPEESQLVFRAPAMSTDCARFISQGEVVSGGNDGTLQVWNQLRKKPLSVVRDAHGPGAGQLHGGPSAGCASEPTVGAPGDAAAGGPSSTVSDVTGWVQSVAVCRNSDLVASGASDGTIRLWRVEKNKMGGAQDLCCIGGLPARGSVNGLALSRSGALVVAALGQEPRLGRWTRDGAARNGIAVFRLETRG